MRSYPQIKDPAEIPYRFQEAWNLYDAQGIAAIFTDDADFVNVAGKWWDNKTDIWKAHDFGLKHIFQHSKLEVLKTKLKTLSDSIVIIHAKIKLIGQTEKGAQKAGERETMFIFVSQKTNNHWLVVSAQNTDITGEQTNIRDESGSLKPVSYKEDKTKITRDLNEGE